MRNSLTLLGIALSLLANASPVEIQDQSSNQQACSGSNLIVQVLQGTAAATSYCSSYLSIGTTTMIATSIVSIATSTVSEATITGTSTLTANTVTATVTGLAMITICIPTAHRAKRGNNNNGLSIPLPLLGSTSTSGSKTLTTSSASKMSSATSSASSTPSTSTNTALTAYSTSQISSECSCLSITSASTAVTTVITSTPVVTVISSIAATATITPSTTVTQTSTSTVSYCPTPTSCGNQGVGWAIYSNGVPFNADSTYSAFDPTTFKSLSPDYNATTSTIGGISDQQTSAFSIYGSSQTFGPTYFALNHRGYLYAEVSGTYNFSLIGADDISLLWVGKYAYSGYTRGNANAANIVSSSNPWMVSYSVDLVAQTYYPIRIIFGQAQGVARFNATVSAPDGTVILSSANSSSPYLVQYSCDGTSAPVFPAFGSES